LRKTALATCIVVVTYICYHYVDYQKVNNRLLEDIHRQNADLKRKMELVQLSSKSGEDDFSIKKDVADGLAHLDPLTGGSGIVSDSGVMADEDSSDDDLTLSFNSTQTDRTWMAAEGNTMDDLSVCSSSENEEEDFLTAAANSRNNSPPFNLSHPLSVVNVTGDMSSPAKLISGRTSRTSRRSSRASTPAVEVASTPPTHRYFLRARKSDRQMNSSLLEEESEQSFVRKVREARNVSKRNTNKILMALKRGQDGQGDTDM